MSEVYVSVFARTDIGMHRSGNEDAFLVADLSTGNVGLGPEISNHRIGARGSLLVVSDGMGGAVAGEIASEMAVSTLREALADMTAEQDIGAQLVAASEAANHRIWEHAQQNPELAGMGATLTAVLVHGSSAYIGQVGDSRAYLIRGRQIKQITKDQSLAQMLVDSGVIPPEQAAAVPQNVIMQALGTQPTVKVVLSVVDLCQGDHLLICSDGLSNKIKPEEMRQTILDAENLNAACRRMVEVANERGGEDNITVIVARFDGEALAAASDTITGSYRTYEAASERPAPITAPLASQPQAEPPQAGETAALDSSALAENFDAEALGITRPLDPNAVSDALGITRPLDSGNMDALGLTMPLAAPPAPPAAEALQPPPEEPTTAPLESPPPAPPAGETLPLAPAAGRPAATAPAIETPAAPPAEARSVEHLAPSVEHLAPPVAAPAATPPSATRAAAAAPSRSYIAVWVAWLLSLLLIGVGGYAFYRFYQMQHTPPPEPAGQTVKQPAEGQQ